MRISPERRPRHRPDASKRRRHDRVRPEAPLRGVPCGGFEGVASRAAEPTETYCLDFEVRDDSRELDSYPTSSIYDGQLRLSQVWEANWGTHLSPHSSPKGLWFGLSREPYQPLLKLSRLGRSASGTRTFPTDSSRNHELNAKFEVQRSD